MRFDSVKRLWVLLSAAIVAPVALAAPAAAAVTVVEGSGTVSGITAAPGRTTTGAVVVGDTLRFRFSFDTAFASRIFDNGIGDQRFVVPIGDLNISVGSSQFSPATASTAAPMILIGNGFSFLGSPMGSEPVFTQSFGLPGLGIDNAPFAPSANGFANISLSSLFRSNHTGQVPTLADLQSPASAERNNFFVAFGDDNGFAGNIRGTFTATFATAAVPEPETWAMLILGFGVIGAAMRGGGSRRALFAG